MSTLLDLPTELIEGIGLNLDFADVVSLMTTCSTLWHLRYNFSFWRHYHYLKHGPNTPFLVEKLNDPYRSVRRRSQGRWILAEKIIDIIYNLTKRDSLELNYAYVFGGYLRDRLARRLNFRDINISISYDDYKSMRQHFSTRLYQHGFVVAPYPDPSETLTYRVYDKNNPGVNVDVRLVLYPLSQIAVDFDINSLYLKDRKTLAVRVPTKEGDLDRIISQCQKKIFSLSHVRMTNLDHLLIRYEHMIKLGFTFQPPIAHLP
jgi:hypothetical protein